MHTNPAPNALKCKRDGPEEIFDPSKKVAGEEAREASILAMLVHHDVNCDVKANRNSIQKNKTDSPLLRLPVEILEKIVTLVVGGQTLHLQYKRYQRNTNPESTRYG